MKIYEVTWVSRNTSLQQVVHFNPNGSKVVQADNPTAAITSAINGITSLLEDCGIKFKVERYGGITRVTASNGDTYEQFTAQEQ